MKDLVEQNLEKYKRNELIEIIENINLTCQERNIQIIPLKKQGNKDKLRQTISNLFVNCAIDKPEFNFLLKILEVESVINTQK